MADLLTPIPEIMSDLVKQTHDTGIMFDQGGRDIPIPLTYEVQGGTLARVWPERVPTDLLYLLEDHGVGLAYSYRGGTDITALEGRQPVYQLVETALYGRFFPLIDQVDSALLDTFYREPRIADVSFAFSDFNDNLSLFIIRRTLSFRTI